MSQKQIREIKVIVDTKGAPGLKQMADGFKKVNRSVQQTTSVLTTFRNAFLAIQGLQFAGIGIREIVGAADSMQKLNDRLTLTEGSAAGAKTALAGLEVVAFNTKTTIDDIATVYNRLNMSMKDTKIGTDALLGFTAALQQSFRLSGATAVEAISATIQLSQGLASGQLRGQELRSVLEQNALAGDILAKQFGTTRGQLLKYSEAAGGLDAGGVLAAYADAAEDLNRQASALTPTLSEGLATSLNKAKLSLNEFNKSVGGTQKILAAMDFTFENFGGILATVFAVALWSKRIAIVAALTAKWTSAVVVFKVASGVLVMLAGALFSPIAASIALGAGLVALMFNLDGVIKKTKEFMGISNPTKTLSDVDKMREGWYAASSAQNNYVTSAKKNAAITRDMLNPEMGEFNKVLLLTSGNLASTPGAMDRYVLALRDHAKTMQENSKLAFNFTYELTELNNKYLDGTVSLDAYNKKLKEIKLTQLEIDFRKGKFDESTRQQKLNEIMNGGKPRKSIDEMRVALKRLNAEYRQGGMSLTQYASELEGVKLDKINRDLKTGRSDIVAHQKAMNAHKIGEYRRELAIGTMSMDEFTSEERRMKLQMLNMEFKTGAIDIHEYNKALIEAKEEFDFSGATMTGLHNYIQSAGTLSTNVANFVTNTFGTLEQSIFDFTKTGKFAIEEFTMSVLDDLNRIIIRAMIIRPLAQGLLGAFGPGDAGSNNFPGNTASLPSGTMMAAKGAAFNRGVEFFAKGGVVTNPTSFQHSRGLGVMGEAGPEAIIPLRRTSSGDLGVQSAPAAPVIVNITNQTGGEVEQTESRGPNGERMLDILIKNKVKETFASGSMDSQMSAMYGVRRRGI